MLWILNFCSEDKEIKEKICACASRPGWHQYVIIIRVFLAASIDGVTGADNIAAIFKLCQE